MDYKNITCGNLINYFRTFKVTKKVNSFLLEDGRRVPIRLFDSRKDILVLDYISILKNIMVDAGTGNNPCETLRFMPFIKRNNNTVMLRLNDIISDKHSINMIFDSVS